MNSFLTGSNRYGTTYEDSDIDLVIRCSGEEARNLIAQSDKPPCEALVQRYGISGLRCIRFGKLNLLICTDDEHFAAWKLGTEMCLRRSECLGHPLDRDEAVEIFTNLFENSLP